jgi:DNA-binding CsgD family transcriptional regulator
MGNDPKPQNSSGYENQPPPEQPAFSVQEQEMLPYFLQGKRDPEIAMILSANPRTVEGTSRKILSKYHAETRAAAVASYYEIEMGKLLHELEIVRSENATMKLQLAKIRRILERD